MSQSTADSLLAEIEAFCRRSGIAESTFGRQSVNDGKLCVRLRNGKDVTLETAAKIRDFIEKRAARSRQLNGAESLEQSNNKGRTTMSGNAKRKASSSPQGRQEQGFRNGRRRRRSAVSLL